MPPRAPRAPLRVQNPDNNSDSSDEQSDDHSRYFNSRATNGIGHLNVLVPLSPSSSGNNTLQGLVIQTPVSPLSISNSLPSHSYQADRSHVRRPSDSQRPFPVSFSFILQYPSILGLSRTGADCNHRRVRPPTSPV